MPRSLDQRLGQAERKRRIVGPLPRLQVEHPAAYHASDLRKGAPPLELGRRPDSITAGKANEDAARPVHAIGQSRGTTPHPSY